jgi:colanic acid/amylovoran biosynthesis protein
MLGCEVIVSTGGTYLVDHYDFDNKVTELEIAHAIGKPVYLWTQSMGPFRSDRARTSVRRLSGLASGVFFRDAKSQDYWMAVNEAPPVSAVVPDVAFVLPAPGPATPAPHSPLALISVREWKHSGAEGGDYDPETYRRSMRTFAEQLLSRGWRVTAVSTCQGVPSYGVDDSRLAAEIFAGLDVLIDTDHHVPEDLQRLIQTADLVLTTRMHLAILSLVGGVPTLAVAYEFKTVELFRSLGLAENVVSLEETDASWVETQVARLDAQGRPATLSEATLAELRERAAAPARQSVGALVAAPSTGLSG